MPQPWAIVFYETASGQRPAAEFVARLSPVDLAAIVRKLDLLEEYGTDLQMPHARHLGKSLWELRGGYHNRCRLMYCAHTGRRIIILHGYLKQSNRAPRREIETALRRWDDFKEREAAGRP